MVINKPTFNKPTVYSDYNVWGTKLNTVLNLQDAYNGQLATIVAELFTSVITLEDNKIDIDDISTYVAPTMDNYYANTIKPEIDTYVNDTSLVSIDNYVDTKKTSLDASILEGHELTTELNERNTTASLNIAKLTSENSEASTNISTLQSENTRGEELYSNLEPRINSAETAKNELDLSIENGTTSKTNLDESIATGDTVNGTLNTTISTATTSQSNLQDKIDEVPSLIQSITDEGTIQINNVIAEGNVQLTKLTYSSYVEITDIDTDFNLQTGYYEVFDAKGNQFSVRVDSTLEIPENSVIKDVAGYVRLQGVEMPCKIAIRDYPTITDNTSGMILLEIESDFENSGSTEAIKSLIK